MDNNKEEKEESTTAAAAAHAVTHAMESFADLIGITPDQLAAYSPQQCETLLRKLLACQTLPTRASPQKVVGIIDPSDVKRMDYESRGRAWTLAHDQVLSPAFYTYVAAHTQFTPQAIKNPMFQRFYKHINTGLPKDQRIQRREAWLLFHLLNVEHVRPVLMAHFDHNVKEVNRVHNLLTAFLKHERQVSGQTPSQIGTHIGNILKGTQFTLFENDLVYLGAHALVGTRQNDTTHADTATTDIPDAVTIGHYDMPYAAHIMNDTTKTWSPQAEDDLRRNAALSAFRQAQHLPQSFSSKAVWQQAIVSSVVPQARREALTKDTMQHLIGRKQHLADAWKGGQDWLDAISDTSWHSMWDIVSQHVNCGAIVTEGRAQKQSQVLYNALCSEMGESVVKHRYGGGKHAGEFLRVLITSHLPKPHNTRLLLEQERDHRGMSRALDQYRDACPEAGRALLRALCGA